MKNLGIVIVGSCSEEVQMFFNVCMIHCVLTEPQHVSDDGRGFYKPILYKMRLSYHIN